MALSSPSPLGPGVVGRIDPGSSIVVDLPGGRLASVSRNLLLNGANRAAIRSDGGAWEVVQFQTAEEVAPGSWLLSDLLRGQLGTEDAMAAGASAGAQLVVLDEAVRPAGLRPGEAGLLLNWRVGPTGHDLSDSTYRALSATGAVRARLPLAPVHLRAAPAGGDVLLSWVRRGRVDADDWMQSDIPLGEESEAYQVEIANPGGALVRAETVTAPAYLYPATVLAADFGTPPPEIDVTVRQFSVAVGWGIPASRRLALA